MGRSLCCELMKRQCRGGGGYSIGMERKARIRSDVSKLWKDILFLRKVKVESRKDKIRI